MAPETTLGLGALAAVRALNDSASSTVPATKSEPSRRRVGRIFTCSLIRGLSS